MNLAHPVVLLSKDENCTVYRPENSWVEGALDGLNHQWQTHPHGNDFGAENLEPDFELEDQRIGLVGT
jgi:hypothetical protein